MKNWIDSAVMKEFMGAVRAGDFIRQISIVDHQVQVEEGSDKAFWLLERAVVRARRLYPVLDSAWADLEAALAAAPDDLWVKRTALLDAFSFSLRTEQFDQLRQLFPGIRPDLPSLQRDPLVQGCMGDLQIRRGRWRAALRCLSRCIAGMEAYDPVRRAHYLGTLASVYARRAVVAFKAGKPRLGSQDIQRALALAEQVRTVNFDPVVLALAKAEEAFQQCRFQAARQAIQEGIAQRSPEQEARAAPDLLVETELLAARIARAEGQSAAVAYFCDRARKVVGYRNLPLTVAHIEAVRRGAD